MVAKGYPKKILITGGAGYISNQLIEELPPAVEIICIDNFYVDSEYKRKKNKKLHSNHRVSLIDSNVAHISKYQHLLSNIDLLIYMASLNSVGESQTHPIKYLKENNLNLQLFLNQLKKFSPKLKKIILTSSRGVYGEGPYLCQKCRRTIYPDSAEALSCSKCNSTELTPQKIKESDQTKPASYYGLTKKIQEDLLSVFSLQYNIQMDIFRIFNVYGKDQGKYYSNIGIIPQMFKLIKTQHQICLSGNGKLTRDFVSITDLVNILKMSVVNSQVRTNLIETYNVGSGRAVSLNDLAEYFQNLGYSFNIILISSYQDVQYSVANNQKVKKAFNIKKFSNLYDFLARTYGKNC